jgi:hypothetical protein
MGFLSDGESYEFVPGGMEIDAVNTLPESVVGAQLREAAVCLTR